MTSRERMQAVWLKQSVDRYPFVPAIYEHGARVIDRAPVEVCRSPALMAEAALASYRCYGHDLVSVGLDIYNVEAEAFGCRVSDGAELSIPGIVSHPLAGMDELDPVAVMVPAAGAGNRLGLVVEAARRVVEQVGGDVWVYGCMSGAFSQAVELRGFENLIADMMLAPERVHALLEKTAELSVQQATRFAEVGCSVNIFESWATLPLISPDIFRDYVVPYDRRAIAAVRAHRGVPPPAVIMGGNTALLMEHFVTVGTSLVVADFNTDFDFMRDRTRDHNIIVRGCVDPKLIERGDWPAIESSVRRLREKAAGMPNFVWGCGAVSFNTPSEHVLRFKELCVGAGQ